MKACSHLAPNSLPQIRQMVVYAQRCSFNSEDTAKIKWLWARNLLQRAYQTCPAAQPHLRQELEILAHQFLTAITILGYSTIRFPIDEAPGVKRNT